MSDTLSQGAVSPVIGGYDTIVENLGGKRHREDCGGGVGGTQVIVSFCEAPRKPEEKRRKSGVSVVLVLHKIFSF